LTDTWKGVNPLEEVFDDEAQEIHLSFRFYHNAAFHVHVLFPPVEYGAAVIIERAGIFGNESEGSAFTVLNERGCC